MKRLRIAVIGFGRLGRACAGAIGDASDLELGGIVLRGGRTLPAPFAHVPSAEHIRDLENIRAALVCVPAQDTTGVALQLLQSRMPIVECSQLVGHAREAHYEAIQTAAQRHRVPAIVGAGWDPGALALVQGLFEVLIPHGQTSLTRHPGLTLHHNAGIEDITGVEEALIGEFRDAEDNARRYVYVRLAAQADEQSVRQAIKGDPLFADETTEVFVLPDLTGLEASSGVVIERRCSAATAHQHAALSFDARFDLWDFAARVMLDAARAIVYLRPGAHRYAFGPSSMPTLLSA